MKKNIAHKTPRDEHTVSDLKVWSAIRHLDPDINPRTRDVAVFIVLLAAVSVVSVVCVLLRLYGL